MPLITHHHRQPLINVLEVLESGGNAHLPGVRVSYRDAGHQETPSISSKLYGPISPSNHNEAGAGQSDSEAETVIIGALDEKMEEHTNRSPTNVTPSLRHARNSVTQASEPETKRIIKTEVVTEDALKGSSHDTVHSARIRSPDPIIGKRKRDGSQSRRSGSEGESGKNKQHREDVFSSKFDLNGRDASSVSLPPLTTMEAPRPPRTDQGVSVKAQKAESGVAPSKTSAVLSIHRSAEQSNSVDQMEVDEKIDMPTSMKESAMGQARRSVDETSKSSASVAPFPTFEYPQGRAGSEPVSNGKDGSLSSRRRRNSKRQPAAPILPPSSRRLHYHSGDIPDIQLDNRLGVPHSISFSEESSLLSPLKMPKKLIDATGRTFLARACASEKQEIEKVRDCCEEHPDHLNTPDYAGTRPLHEASLQGFTAAVDYLIEKHCDINIQNEDGDTALIDAAANGHLETVQALLRGGANPTNRNRKGEDALDAIIVNDEDGEDDKRNVENIKDAINKAKIKWARDRRASEGERRPRFDVEDETPTSRDQSVSSRHHSPHLSARSGQISPPPKNLQGRRGKRRGEFVGNSALYFDAQKCTQKELIKATELGDKQRVLQILDNKPSLASLEPLLIATKGGDEMLINLLVVNMANDEEVDPDPSKVGKSKKGQHTPILAAIGRGKPEIVRLLLETKRIDPSRTFDGKSYSEIARERQSDGWEEEYDMLEQHRAEKMGVLPRKRPADTISQEFTPSPKKVKLSGVSSTRDHKITRISTENAEVYKPNGTSSAYKTRKVIDSSPESDDAEGKTSKRGAPPPDRGDRDAASNLMKRQQGNTSPTGALKNRGKISLFKSDPDKQKLTLVGERNSVNAKPKAPSAMTKGSKIRLTLSSLSKQPASQNGALGKRSDPPSSKPQLVAPQPSQQEKPTEIALSETTSSPIRKKESLPSNASTPLTTPGTNTPSFAESIPSPKTVDPADEAEDAEPEKPVPPPEPVETLEELMDRASARAHQYAQERCRVLQQAQQAHQARAQQQAHIDRLTTQVARLEEQLAREEAEEAAEAARKQLAIQQQKEAEQRRIDGFPHGLRTWYLLSSAQKQSEQVLASWLPIFCADGSLRYDSAIERDQEQADAEERLVPNFQAAALLADSDLSLASRNRFAGPERRRMMTPLERRHTFGKLFHLRLVDPQRRGEGAHFREQSALLEGMAGGDLFWVRMEDLVAELQEVGLGGKGTVGVLNLPEPVAYDILPNALRRRRIRTVLFHESLRALGGYLDVATGPGASEEVEILVVRSYLGRLRELRTAGLAKEGMKGWEGRGGERRALLEEIGVGVEELLAVGL